MIFNRRDNLFRSLTVLAFLAIASCAQAKSQKTFTDATYYPVGTFPDTVAVADFNRDGIQDLAVTDRAGGVNILLGKKNGGFAPAVFYAAGQTPFGIAVADINGDKVLDIVLADVSGNQIDVLLGKGDGSFQSPLTYPAGLQPTYVAVADLNHDGLPDVVINQDLELVCTLIAVKR